MASIMLYGSKTHGRKFPKKINKGLLPALLLNLQK